MTTAATTRLRWRAHTDDDAGGIRQWTARERGHVLTVVETIIGCRWDVFGGGHIQAGGRAWTFGDAITEAERASARMLDTA